MSGSSRSSLFGVVLGIAALAGGGYWLLRGRDAAKDVAPVVEPAQPVAKQPEAKPADPVAKQPEGKPAEPVAAPLPTPESAGVPKEDCIAYPDGSRLPPLNGVKKAPPITFHRQVPFARVLRKEFDKATGLEWYIHENGVRSTTRLQWRNGVQEAVSEVDMPRAVLPVDPK